MINKVRGTKFENKLCAELSNNGVWCRLMYPAPDGSQPFDVMAISPKGALFCFECKDCLNDTFQLSRIESNQEISLTRLMYQYNLINRVFFAFNTSLGIYILNADYVLEEYRKYMFTKKDSKLTLKYIMTCGVELKKFIEESLIYGK